MPRAEEKRRGGVTKYRTIHPPGRPDKYMHIAVVRKTGPKGGKTVAGPVHTKKKKSRGRALALCRKR